MVPSSTRASSELRTTPSPSPSRSSESGCSPRLIAGRAVVLDRRLPAVECLELGRGGRLERERQLPPLPRRLRRAGDPELPVALAPPQRQAVEGAGPGQALEPVAAGARAGREVGDAGVGAAALALGDQRLHLLLAHPLDVAEADADDEPAALALDPAEDVAAAGVGRRHPDPAPLRLVDERVGRVEAHRLLVQQRAEELGAVVDPQPGRLVGEQPERGRVRLREAEAGEALDLEPDPLGDLGRDPALPGPGDEALVVGADRLLGALAAHRPPQPLGLRGGEARQLHRHLDHLLLEDDRAERLRQDRLQQRVFVGDLERGVLPQPLAALYIGVDGAALDRAGADQGDLDGEVVEVGGPGAGKHLHLRPALDLEDAGRLRRPDRLEGLGVVVGDPREVDPLAPHPLDLDDAALDRREHPQPQQVDLEEAGVGAGVLVPLDGLAALHRRRHDRADVDQGPGRDHHPAGMLGGVAGKAHRLGAERRQRPPAGRGRSLGADRVPHVALDLPRLAVEADHPRHPLDLPRRQPQRLAEVAHRAARAVGREGGDQRRAVGAVAAVDLGDQDLADVAGEVEVDVGHRRHLLVEEAGDEEVGLDRVDVGEPGQVADDRADARPPPPARRQHRPGRARPPHPDRDLARQLEQVAVQEEEPGEAEVADHPQLLLQPALGLAPVGGAGVALGEPAPAVLGQVAVGAGVLGARVAVAELGGEVEPQPLRQPQRLRHRLGMLGEAQRHPLRRGEGRARVAAPQRLGLVEAGTAADGDERVLEPGAGAAVAVDVAARHAGHAQPLRQPGQPAVAGAVAPLVGPLQLDPQALGPEGLEQLAAERRRPRALAALPAAGEHPVAGAAAEADQALGVLLHPAQPHPRLPGSALGAVAGVGVGGGEEAAEVAVAGGGLDQQGQVGELRPVGPSSTRRSARRR